MRLLTVLLFALIGQAARAVDPPTWPQWRGPTRDGITTGQDFPDTLSTLKSSWRVDLGPSYSGPIILADRVVVTESADSKTERVRALDRVTGKELWRAEWPGGQTVVPEARPRGEAIRATPASDGKQVYVGGMRDLLVCLDAADGKQRWRVDFVKEFGTRQPDMGMASSPQADGAAVYTLAATGIVRVDAATGKVAWRTLTDDPKQEGGATSSVVVARVAGRKTVVALNRKTLALLDPESGNVRWKQTVPAYRNCTTVTPVLVGDAGIVVSMFSGRTMRFDITAADDSVSGRRTWDISQTAYLSTPVRVGDYLYCHLQSQRAACLDTRTGRTLWTTSQTFGEYWSMAVRGDRILALDQRGILYLFRADPTKFELLDERRLEAADTWGHLAVCGDEVFVRDMKGLTAYRWPGK
jgi:outer membrane protein assembly factor BamB